MIKAPRTNSASNCKVQCTNLSNCVAIAYNKGNGICALYQNGPYTYGDGVANVDCYINILHKNYKKTDYKKGIFLTQSGYRD